MRMRRTFNAFSMAACWQEKEQVVCCKFGIECVATSLFRNFISSERKNIKFCLQNGYGDATDIEFE